MRTLDRSQICRALKQLRLDHFPVKSRFLAATGFAQGTLDRTESGEQLPMMDVIQRWLDACGGMTLTQFFSGLEGVPIPGQVQIPPQYRKLIEHLLRILDNNQEAHDFFQVAIETFHRAYRRKRKS